MWLNFWGKYFCIYNFKHINKDHRSERNESSARALMFDLLLIYLRLSRLKCGSLGMVPTTYFFRKAQDRSFWFGSFLAFLSLSFFSFPFFSTCVSVYICMCIGSVWYPTPPFGQLLPR